MSAANDGRRADLVARLAAVRSRIAGTCLEVGRDPYTVRLIAVTKTYPADDVATLVELGVRDIGENRDQEARAKIAELAPLLAAAGEAPESVRWHVVGRLQTNKARHVARYAYAVHSVDRVELATALADAAARVERSEPLRVFVQVSLDGDPNRGGVIEADLSAVGDAVAGRAELRLVGVMAVAPIEAEPDAAFATLRELSAAVSAAHPDATAISAGMSDDLEAAIRNGATDVRVGSALLGRRPPPIG